jgi:hypothetical protein
VIVVIDSHLAHAYIKFFIRIKIPLFIIKFCVRWWCHVEVEKFTHDFLTFIEYKSINVGGEFIALMNVDQQQILTLFVSCLMFWFNSKSFPRWFLMIISESDTEQVTFIAAFELHQKKIFQSQQNETKLIVDMQWCYDDETLSLEPCNLNSN